MTDTPELRPARPEAQDAAEQSYMPKLPWKWILGLGLFLGASLLLYRAKESQEADALRGAIQTTYAQKLAPLVKRHDALVRKIYERVEWAARREGPATSTDERLDFDRLHEAKGLYLRLETKDATSKERIRAALGDVFPDAIGKCLGLSPYSAAELLVRGEFLEKGWFERADNASGVMRLRVIAEEIRQRSERDLPFVAEALQSQWFMLVLQRGPNRRDAPVDVYLWDLRNDQLLLSKRLQADGALVSARIAMEGVKKGNYGTGAQTGAAQDCSIASQLRALTGKEATTFGATPPAPRAAIEAGKPAQPGASAPAAPGASAPAAPGASAPAAPGASPSSAPK